MTTRKRKQTRAAKRVSDWITYAINFDLKGLYFLWGLMLALATVVIVNFPTVVHWLNTVNWALVKDFLAVLLAWPSMVGLLGIIFMWRFRDAIRAFLVKVDRFKAPGFELSQQQAAAQPTSTDSKEQKAVEGLENKTSDDGSVTLTKSQVDELVNIFEGMDFKFLNLHLVMNTKNALKMMTQMEVRKSAFLQVYQVPPQVTDQIGERRAILSALFDAGLIYEDNDVLKATDRGLRFLAFAGV